MFVCPICKSEFYRASKLKRHVMLVHVGSDWPSAPVCGQEKCLRTFGSLEKWYDHVRKQHKVLEESYSAKRPRTEGYHSNATLNIEQHDSSSSQELDTSIENEYDYVWRDVFNGFREEIDKVSAKFVASMKANSSVTASTYDMAIKLCNEVVDVVVHGIKETTKLFLNEKQPTLDASELLDMFEQVTQPLLFLSDNRKQQQYFRSLGTYIKPIEYSFGSRRRFEPVMNPGTGHVTQKATHNTWMYVPIKETLRVVLSQPGFINNVQMEGRNDEFIRDFVDGESFNTHALFSDKSRLSIAIDLYADDIECANPLGSKATVHKICVWLFTIKNLPAYFNSAMQNIHLVALVHTADIKSYGYNVITKKISEDIKDLEINGIEIEVNGVKQTVFASLGLVNADNLSRHGVFGFKEGFTAKKPCSTCFIDYSEIQETFRHSEFQLRTEQQYFRHLQQVESGQITSTDCGIVKSCELNNTTHWQVTRNYCGDLMHDFLEGVAPFETKLVLKELVEKGSCP